MKLKKLLASVVAAAMLLSTMGLTAFAEEKTVATADDFYKAVSEAQSGDVINLTADIEQENWNAIWEKENLTINGNGKKLTVKAVGTGTNGGGLLLRATNLTINDLTVVLPAKTATESPRLATMYSGTLKNVKVIGGVYGVSVLGGGDVSIENCTFEGQSDWTIETDAKTGNEKLTITGCTFEDNAVILRGTNNTFTGNTITGEGEGVNVLGDGVVSDNDFGESSLGINSGVNVKIENNTINNVEFTTWYVPEGEEADYSNVTVTDNELSAEALEELKTEINGVEENNTIAVSNAAKIGDTYYETLSESVNKAKSGDTIELLADAADTGTLLITDGVTFEGNGYTISGNSAIHMSGKSTVQNTYFKNTSSNAIWSEASGIDITIQNCTFENVGWDAILISGTHADSDKVTITGNVFKGTSTAGRYVHIQPSGKPKMEITVTENKMYNTEDITAIGAWFAHEDSTIVLSENYMQEPSAVSVTVYNDEGQQTNISEIVFPCYADDTMTTLADKPCVKVLKDIYNADYYETLADAIAAAQEGNTINIFAGTISEGTIKLPATMKNVTIKGEEGAILKDMTISASDGNSYSYIGLTFDGIVFDNSRLLFTGWRNDEEIIENLTITNCTFKNLNDETNNACVHINKDVSEPVNGFTFTNNVIDGATGGSKSGIYSANTGNVTITGNTFNNIVFRPALIQLADCDGTADNVVVSDNVFSNTTRLQIYGSETDNGDGTWTPSGTDTVEIAINENIFTDISGYYICTWGINGEADIAKNYYDTTDLGGKIYWNNEKPADEAALAELGVYPVYTELNEDGTINLESEYTYVPTVAKIGEVGYNSLAEAMTAAADGAVIEVADGNHTLASISNKAITIKGGSGAIIDCTTAITMNGADITFDGVTIKGANANYIGLHHIKTQTYKNCIIDGELWTYGTAVFEKCTFNQTSSGLYNLWTYSAPSVTITDCTFNSAGKSVLVYNEGATATELEVSNSAFNASTPVEGKAAIEIDTRFCAISVDVENSTATGFATGSVSGNTLWNNKNDNKDDDGNASAGQDLLVVVNDETVMNHKQATEGAVAEVNGTEYTTLQAAVEAAENGDTIKLINDTSEEVQIVKNVTIDLNSKTLNGAILEGSKGNIVVKNGSIKNANSSVSAIEINEGSLLVENVNIDSERHAVRIDGAVTATINGGVYKVLVNNKVSAHTINVSGSAVVTIKNGTFYGPKGTPNGSAMGGSALQSRGDAVVTIEGGSFSGGVNNTIYGAAVSNVSIKGGTFDQNPTAYVADGYAALLNLEDQYVVGEKPTATVNNLGAMTIPESEYTVYGGSKSGDMPLSFVMQFLADQDAEDMATSPYADWYGDFVLTFTGIEDDSFTADGCYLAGYYGTFGWIKVPVDGMTIENGVRYPVMLGVGMGQKYDYICESVKDFRCALYLTPEILKANPNIQVSLELSIVDNSKGEDAAAEALADTTKKYVNVVGETEYEAADFETEPDETLDTNSSFIRNIKTTNVNGEERYQVILFAGLESLTEYSKAGFEITVNGETRERASNTAYTKYTAAGVTYEPEDWGKNCKYIIALPINFEPELKDSSIVFRPFAVKKDGVTKVYAEEKTIDKIYNKVEVSE